MNLLRAFSVILLGISLFACNAKNKSEEKTFALASEGAIFRSVNMGDLPSDVLSKEEGEAVFLSDTLMQYKGVLTLAKEEIEAVVYYNFDEYGLFEIQADYFAAGLKRNTIFQSMNDYLTGQYGEASRSFESLRWTTPSASNTLIEISLSKETDLEGNPFISLNYLEPLNEEL